MWTYLNAVKGGDAVLKRVPGSVSAVCPSVKKEVLTMLKDNVDVQREVGDCTWVLVGFGCGRGSWCGLSWDGFGLRLGVVALGWAARLGSGFWALVRTWASLRSWLGLGWCGPL